MTSRGATNDFVDIVRKNRSKFANGVVHSFTGELQEMRDLTKMGLYIGVSGCSLNTDRNCAMVKEIPLENLVIGSNCPFCDIRPVSSSNKHIQTRFKTVKLKRYSDIVTRRIQNPSTTWEKDTLLKFRNEPCKLVQVVEVIAALKGMPIEQIIKAIYENTKKLFKGRLPEPRKYTKPLLKVSK